MKTIIVDDDNHSVIDFLAAFEQHDEINVCGTFHSYKSALEYIENYDVEFAVLDIELPEGNGLDLAEAIRNKNKNAIIIFITGHGNYAFDAMKKKADYIVFKPYSDEDIQDVIARAKLLSMRLDKYIECSCFGRFELSVNGELVNFESNKVREVFAYCVCRCGDNVPSSDIVSAVWGSCEGRPGYCAAYRTTIDKLRSVLEHYGISEIFVNEHRYCRINTEKINCDFFRYINSGDLLSADLRNFMPEYVWAEQILAIQLNKSGKRIRQQIS